MLHAFAPVRISKTIERNGNRQAIIVTELPYQVNKARLLEKIAELVKEKRIDGISELRDESDKDGMRMVIELRRGENSDVILNNLFKQTMMQSVFGINMVALVDGQPKLLNVKEIISEFLKHRREIVTRRSLYELRKARDRAHLLEGQAVALANIDEVIALIKSSPTPAEAKARLLAPSWKPGVVTELLERAGANATRPQDLDPEFGLLDGEYRLSEAQAQAILDLRLHKLTGLEQEKIVKEYKSLIDIINELLEILSNPDRLAEVIREELQQVREEFADPRRTEITEDHSDLTVEDLILEENVVVTLSHSGYAKSQPLSAYQAQRRGGRGKAAARVKDEDFIATLFVANTHDTLLCFSSRGKLYWLKVYNLPAAGRGARGRPIVNLLPLEGDERITAVLPVRQYDEDRFILMATSHGTVKKTPLSSFSRPRSNGIIALGLRGDDQLVDAQITNGNDDIVLCASNGKAIRFPETDVRPMGRTAAGVRGIRLAPDNQVIALIIPKEETLLLATENGYGKRTPATEFSVQGRGGQGIIAVQTSARNGRMVGALQVKSEDEIMLISSNGTLVRTPVEDVSIMGRNTQGVRLIRLSEADSLVGLARVETLSEDESVGEVSESIVPSDTVEPDDVGDSSDEDVSH